MNVIYLDNAATTQLRLEVVDAMSDILKTNYGNPSSTHSFGRTAKSVLEQCRKDIASYFGASAAEIVFTSGGTESDNLVLRSAVRDLGVTTIITSKVEHHAVLHTAEELEREYGISVKYVNLTHEGEIDLQHLEGLLKQSNKCLVSLMHVNNEIGNIMDIHSVAQLCEENMALFHSDMVQSVGHYKIDVNQLKIDFFAASAHKFHGPKGVGFCFVRQSLGLKPLIFGGEQERGYRAGTEALHNIYGMNEALKLAYGNLEEEKQKVLSLKTYFKEQLQHAIPNVAFNGNSGLNDKSTFTLLSVRLPIDANKASLLQFQLDLKGIACSKGSACQSGSVGQSHVLEAILNPDELNQPSLRFSFSVYNTNAELDEVVKVLADIVKTE